MTHQQSNMRTAGVALIVIGILFALTAVSLLHPVAHLFLQVAYWPIQTIPSDVVAPVPLLLAITGGLTAGLGAMQWALGTYVAGSAPEAAAKVATLAAWAWFVTDSTGSVLAGAPFNVVLNLSFLVLLLWSGRARPEIVQTAA